LIWLSQTAYIDKIVRLASIISTKVKVPIAIVELLPFEGRAEPYSVRVYKVKVRSILYATVITRPDIAFAVSQLIRFNTNLGLQHYKVAD